MWTADHREYVPFFLFFFSQMQYIFYFQVAIRLLSDYINKLGRNIWYCDILFIFIVNQYKITKSKRKNFMEKMILLK